MSGFLPAQCAMPASMVFAAASPASEALIATAKTLGLKNFFSWRNMQISPPTFTALSPMPSVMSRIGGAAASPRTFLASSDASGQVSRLACLAASFMAKARQVGCPHFLQFVLGRYLKISTPERAIVYSFQRTLYFTAEDAEEKFFLIFSVSPCLRGGFFTSTPRSIP